VRVDLELDCRLCLRPAITFRGDCPQLSRRAERHAGVAFRKAGPRDKVELDLGANHLGANQKRPIVQREPGSALRGA